MNQRICPHCGAQFTATHPNRVYCDNKCREQAKWERAAKIPCEVCGDPTGYKVGRVKSARCKECTFAPCGTPSAYKRGCRCDECRGSIADAMRTYLANRDPNTGPRCIETGCAHRTVARERCRRHYRAHLKAIGRWQPSPSDAWDNPKRMARYKTRKATLRGANGPTDHLTVHDLIARDGNTCGICGNTIPTARYPHPMSPSIDHIIPLSQGGTHTLDNVRATHLRCNIRRGAPTVKTDIRMSR